MPKAEQVLFVSALFVEKIGTVVTVLKAVLFRKMTPAWILKVVLPESIATLFPIADNL